MKLYEEFSANFIALWNESVAAGVNGELFKAAVFSGPSLEAAQKDFMAQLWVDSVGFTGMKIIRRIVGIAHVADLESIADAELRSACEKRCLVLARRLVVASRTGLDGLTDIHALAAAAREGFAAATPSEWNH